MVLILMTNVQHLVQFIITTPILLLQSTLQHIIHLTVALSLLYALSYRLGIIQRLVQRFIEHELGKALNGAQITITNIEFTFQSPFTKSSSLTPHSTSFFSTSVLRVRELIVHNSHVNKWKWDSPLLVRVGTLDVAFNLWTVVLVPNVVQDIFNHVISTATGCVDGAGSVGGTCSASGLKPILPPSPTNASSSSSSSSASSSPKSIFYMQSNIKEIYSAQAYDVQVFIEKRGNVFNFHLLNPNLDIPNAEQVLQRIGYHSESNLSSSHSSSGGENGVNGKQQPLECPSVSSKSIDGSVVIGDGQDFNVHQSANNQQHHSLQNDEHQNFSRHSSNGSPKLNNHISIDANANTYTNNATTEEPSLVETKANEIVMSIVGAVSTLGHAVHQGGTRGLSDALRNQKDGFVSQLKKVQDLVGTSGTNTSSSHSPINNNMQSSSLSSTNASGRITPTITTAIGSTTTAATTTTTTKGNRTTLMAKEGIQVMKQVGKVVEKNVLNMKEKVLDSYTKPPPLKADYKYPEHPDLFRVGFVELRDVRIFTKEMISRGNSGGGGNSNRDEITMDELPTTMKNGSTVATDTATNSFDLEFKLPQPKPRLTLGVNGWSKPMYVKEVRLYPAELCPPSYSLATILKEKSSSGGGAGTGSAASSSSSSSPTTAKKAVPPQTIDTAALIGLPIEQVSNIIVTKVLTEVAKTNTGQLLTNAFSEVFGWFDVDEF